ncbi:MAG: hypothetical protein KF812_00720 [Fimbriimonadaceae bacterium]|nr:hypothetical protein [Fimbriimonadaceae bacterium]
MICTLLLITQATTTVPVRVDGAGYLRFVDNGRVVYTREAELTVKDGQIVHKSGQSLIPAIRTTSPTFSIDLEGNVQSGGNSVGRIVLALFDSETPQFSGVFATATSRPRLGNPGEDLTGVIRTDRPTQSQTQTTVPTSSTTTTQTNSRVEIRPSDAERNRTPVAPGHIRIHVRGEVVLNGDQATMADIAEIDGVASVTSSVGKVVITTTPPVGINRTLDINYLGARVRPALPPDTEIDWEGATKVVIARECQTVSVDQILAVAKSAATEQTGATLFIDPTNLSAMPAPLGALEVVAERVSVSGVRITVQVAAMVEGQRVATRTVILTNNAPVTNLRPGQRIAVRVVRNALIVELQATIRQVTPATNSVTVQTEAGAVLTGSLAADGVVEVKA